MTKRFVLEKMPRIARLFELFACIVGVLEIGLIFALFLSNSLLSVNDHLLLFFVRLMVVGFLLIFASLYISAIADKRYTDLKVGNWVHKTFKSSISKK